MQQSDHDKKFKHLSIRADNLCLQKLSSAVRALACLQQENTDFNYNNDDCNSSNNNNDNNHNNNDKNNNDDDKNNDIDNNSNDIFILIFLS